MKIGLSKERIHLYSKCTIVGIASEYPQNNWYKLFYKILDIDKIYTISELKKDVRLTR